ncbi:pentapeptide repeat-containing protein [Plantactinospora sp. ZYX-F-223]|uniref:pentapeptide repeat-containing protein n=1 Tax=Plantactinospora sp. ZYX-F-223 TaxID=3144103 RepID=UPI0031FD2C32
MTETTLISIDITGCNLHQVNFSRTRFHGVATFDGATFRHGVQFDGATFGG